MKMKYLILCSLLFVVSCDDGKEKKVNPNASQNVELRLLNLQQNSFSEPVSLFDEDVFDRANVENKNYSLNLEARLKMFRSSFQSIFYSPSQSSIGRSSPLRGTECEGLSALDQLMASSVQVYATGEQLIVYLANQEDFECSYLSDAVDYLSTTIKVPKGTGSLLYLQCSGVDFSSVVEQIQEESLFDFSRLVDRFCSESESLKLFKQFAYDTTIINSVDFEKFEMSTERTLNPEDMQKDEAFFKLRSQLGVSQEQPCEVSVDRESEEFIFGLSCLEQEYWASSTAAIQALDNQPVGIEMAMKMDLQGVKGDVDLHAQAYLEGEASFLFDGIEGIADFSNKEVKIFAEGKVIAFDE